jgi:hypothetical protein
MANLNLSREFGLKSRESSKQLCQTKLKSLDELLESSSEEESHSSQSENEDEQGSQSEDNDEHLMTEFHYGMISDLTFPTELSQIFQSRGLFFSILSSHSLSHRGSLLDLQTSISPSLV